tara:strand:- start:173 stop:580 length:408 start_codon:yes stop_codon:yes gene_type:complete
MQNTPSFTPSQAYYANIHQKGYPSFADRSQEVSLMAAQFERAKKTEYLKPTTIAGFIFSRITSNYLQGVQTPVADLIEVHALSAGTGKLRVDCPDFLHSFERIGNYLRTINDVISPVQLEVTVVHNGDGYYVNIY